jgi:RNA recognition motif-containing protein
MSKKIKLNLDKDSSSDDEKVIKINKKKIKEIRKSFEKKEEIKEKKEIKKEKEIKKIEKTKEDKNEITNLDIFDKKNEEKVKLINKENKENQENKEEKIVYKIIVRNLSFETTKEDLKEYFEYYGTVVSSEIFYDTEERSIGVGSVTFEDEDAYNKSFESDNTEYFGRYITVTESSESTEKKKSFKEKIPEGYSLIPTHRITIQNLSQNITTDDLTTEFKKYGLIKEVRLTDKSFHKIGFIDYSSIEEAENAIKKMDQKVFFEKVIFVKFSLTKLKRGSSSTDEEYHKIKKLKRDATPSEGVVIKNLNFLTTRKTLEKIFEKCGNIKIMDMIENEGKNSGWAIINFYDKNSAEKAMLLDGTKIDNRKIVIEYLDTTLETTKNRIVFKNLPKNTDLEKLYEKLIPYSKVKPIMDEDKKFSGVLIVHLSQKMRIFEIIKKFNQKVYDGNILTVEKIDKN